VTRVGFVGAGRIGGPMIGRLAEAGHEVRALARSPEKADAIERLGARPVASFSQVADQADVVIVCVFSDGQVHEVCLHSGLMNAMRPGAVLVVHTTGSPRTAQIIAAQFPDVDVIDAPISGGPHNIAAGEVTVFVGGGDGAVARIQPVMSAYGDPILHVGPLGTGQAVKLVNNALFAAQIGLLREAVALAGRLGVDEPNLLASVSRGSGASRVGEFISTRGSVRGFVNDVGDFIVKDVEALRKIAAELNSDLGILDEIINAGIKP
jgi:3-hydroxyisobutyrate dehydrogenase